MWEQSSALFPGVLVAFWNRLLEGSLPSREGVMLSWGPEVIVKLWRHHGLLGHERVEGIGAIVGEFLLFYRIFGSMRPHPEEMLHNYIILGDVAQNRRETGEIAAVVQDSLSVEGVPIELLYFRRISLTE
ncbi:hypothetical protein [Paenibacillus dendritiformis]|uniref:hypothetical protein n=1 Tax=Paenibacillus dendritiformis TaxID=130049 RepID=UPI000DAA9095|nr:hypothetical protein [Paenibacillus dendritiformis]PZM63402.1 hypothetical protein DOE73_22110 [Paenibacillus dendritiformis]